MRLWGPSLAGVVAFAIGVAIIVGGYVALHGWRVKYLVRDLYANVGVGLVGIGITVLVIDFLNGRRFDELRRNQLIREVSSRDNGIALQAIAELRASGWITYGCLDKGDFSRADLSHGPLEAVRARRASFAGALLVGANLANSDLEDANFSRADMSRANLERSALGGANCFEANMSNADCGFIDLSRSNLAESTLTGADLRGADLRDSNLAGVDLTDVNLSGAKIGGAMVDERTVLPPSAPMTLATAGSRSWALDAVWPTTPVK
jgi:hypothetical protein